MEVSTLVKLKQDNIKTGPLNEHVALIVKGFDEYGRDLMLQLTRSAAQQIIDDFTEILSKDGKGKE